MLLKKLPQSTTHSLVSSLRTCADYEAMKVELQEQITFLKDFGPGFQTSTGQAHVAETGEEAQEEQEEEAEETEEGVVDLDLSGMSNEAAEVLVLAAGP